MMKAGMILSLIAAICIMGCGDEITKVEIQGPDLTFVYPQTGFQTYPDYAESWGWIWNRGDAGAYNIKAWFTWYNDSAIYDVDYWESPWTGPLGSNNTYEFHEYIESIGIQLDSVVMDISWTSEE